MNSPTIKRERMGQQMMWRLLPMVIILPMVLGGVIAWGERLRYYDALFALAIGVVVTIVVFTIFIVRSAKILDQLDLDRQQAEIALRQAHDQLQQRVAERTAALVAANLQLQQEIQQHEQTEATLRRSQQELSDFVENAIVGLHWVAADGTIIWANQAELDLLGYTREEYIGHSITEFHADQAIIADILQRLLSNQRVEQYEADLRCKDGSIRHVLIDSNASWDNGEFIRTRCFTRDVTERRRAEIALQNQQQELARSNAELQQFAYVASHDLQEPLRMITSYLELLERRYKGQLDDKADKFIAYAVDGAARMQILINDLLSYSRVGSRGQDLELIDCEKILQNVLHNLQMSIEQSDATITHTPLPQVNADPSQLTQLFQNLISNALKFRQEAAPQIHIAVQGNDDKWLFSVQDNGIGMEVQYLERIFIIFQRLHSKTEYPGTGIGLAVCKKIVEQHGGTLWVDSQPSLGSTFHFTLPHLAGTPL